MMSARVPSIVNAPSQNIIISRYYSRQTTLYRDKPQPFNFLKATTEFPQCAIFSTKQKENTSQKSNSIDIRIAKE